MVYVINAESCFNANYNLAKIRNQLFTAKAWVRVVGVGKDMDNLISEYNRIKENHFTLNFIYPTKAERNHMNIVNRDMSEAEKTSVKNNKNNISKIINALETGNLHIEDIDEQDLKKLRYLLKE